MGGVRRRHRRDAWRVICAASAGLAAPLAAQTQPAPPPPQAQTMTINEAPLDKPEKKTEGEPKAPEHIAPDSSEIPLSTLETNDFSLLYFDPIQTYLTP